MYFAAPFVAALAALSTAVEAKRYTCDRRQYADVAHQILNPAFFCKWYLAAPRTTSPLKKYGSRSLTKLCHCFVQNSPRVAGPFKPLRPAAPATTCTRTYYRALRNQYADPASFCRFWLKIGNRPISPIPSMNNPKAVYKACGCYVNQNFPEQQTTADATPVRTTPAATSATEGPGPVQLSTTTTDDTTTTTSTTEARSSTTTTSTTAARSSTTTSAATTTTAASSRTTSTVATSTSTSASTSSVQTVAGTSAGTTTFATLTSSATTSSSSSSSTGQ